MCAQPLAWPVHFSIFIGFSHSYAHPQMVISVLRRVGQPSSLPLFERLDARPSRGVRARSHACGWAERHLGHGAPLAQAVDKSFGPDVK